jgi:antitoxin MazE
MESRVVKWGNSLAIRIPRSIAAETRLEYGTTVDVRSEDGAMVVRAAPSERIDLKALLKKIKKAQLHGEIRTGYRRGREEW